MLVTPRFNIPKEHIEYVYGDKLPLGYVLEQEGVITSNITITRWVSGKVDDYPEFEDETSYHGVSDDIAQILANHPVLQEEGRKFYIQVRPIYRKNQPERDGWRWCKWGPYIGDKNPTADYLYDCTDIDYVLCYHIYELLEEEPNGL